MFKVAVAVLLTTMLVLLIVIGKQYPEALANLDQRKTPTHLRAGA